MHSHILRLDGSLIRIKQNLHLLLLVQDGLQDSTYLLGQDKACCQTGLDAVYRVAHQLTTIRTGKDKVVGSDIHVDTVHNQADLIVSRSKEAAVDTVQQHLGGYGQMGSIVAYLLGKRVGSSILSHYAEASAAVLALHLHSLLIKADNQGLFCQFLNRIYNGLGGDTETRFAILLDNGSRCDIILFAV